MSDCLQCKREMHQLCRGAPCTCAHPPVGKQVTTPVVIQSADDFDKVENNDDDEDEREKARTRTRRTKRDDALRDQQSTGRKRAARLYPLHRDQPCEWRGKSGVGGGITIQGCVDGLQQARHHGPDKNTTNNEEGNVHRICHGCHNRWHAANDKDYDPNKPLKH